MNNKDFLTSQLITYLGNKRKLIPFIDETVNEIITNDNRLSKKGSSKINFFDIFSGSGVVSRYAKMKGFNVFSNDLELYSKIINEAILNTSESKNELRFKKIAFKLRKKMPNECLTDSYQQVLNYLNGLTEPKHIENRYFSLHYAPKNTDNVDFDNERLFYTTENALKIDAIVEKINDKNIFDKKSKNIILTSLMYNMTKHINTSGTMKGFHNGWGGKTKSALNRILSTIKLEKLIFHGDRKIKIFQDYSELLFNKYQLKKMDIIYADPPYNQHQYSANYNHLTTICKNDKYLPGDVVLGSRAGIRKDHNRSDFCKSKRNEDNVKIAYVAFNNFIKSIKTKYLILSYNNEGILSVNELIEILSNNCSNIIKVKKQEYSKFKGGKNNKGNKNVIEYLIIVEFNKCQKANDLETVKDELTKHKIRHETIGKTVDCKDIPQNIIKSEDTKSIIIVSGGNKFSIDKKTQSINEIFFLDYLDLDVFNKMIIVEDKQKKHKKAA
jgi:adenine-specific DNA-methyltransferase